MNLRSFASAFAFGSALAALAPAAPAHARMARLPPEFGVTATLVDRGPSAPHCGVLHVVVPMRFRVDAASRRAVPSDEITVTVSCPELSPVALTVGARYALTLTAAPRSSSVLWGSRPRPAQYWGLVRASSAR